MTVGCGGCEGSYEYKELKGSKELRRILKENKHIAYVSDIRDSNLGFYNGKLAILDFGISSYSMDDFDDYRYNSDDTDNSDCDSGSW